MNAIQKYIATITAFLGTGILVSYILLFKKQNNPCDYWVGMKKNVRLLLHGFQILAAIGFFDLFT